MEKRPEGDLTREEKIKSLEKWCFGHACDPSHCRIYELCQQFTGAWKDQPDDDIDKIFEALWEGPVNPQCEVKIENIKELMEEGYPASKEEIKAALLKSQEAKADAGKAQISLVPMEIVWAIAWIRMYGNRKYGDPENWKLVEPERYRDALMRHLLAYISDPKSVDKESGYPHLWHAACNMAFLMHFDYGDMCHYDLGKAIDGQRHWTPCSLKLPDKEGEYLVTNDAGGMKNVEIDTFAHYEDDGKPFWMTSQNPIAWMPIPDVYEKKEEKHEQ